ncbi:MAG TPA: acetoacetate--CoA ligase [Sporichthyaceae bacterium]|nr:acetoacetate--CoA ligase [Sporichthyaceae bacterium]
MDSGTVLWEPSDERIKDSAMRAYLDWLEAREGRTFADHREFWAWSVEDIERFWTSVWDYFEVAASAPYERVLTEGQMPDVRWFPGARLNWAEHLLRLGEAEALALLCVREGDPRTREVTWGRLRRDVAAAAGWLRRAGVGPGDRVAAYLPNTEHAVVACLATAAVGAVWACCSPDFGAEGTVGRLAQLEPTLLIAVDGYHWNGKDVDRRDVVAKLRASLPTLRHTVHVPYVFDEPGPADSVPWDDVVARDAEPHFEQVDFSHPLWVLFTSGTTGLPKGLVHGHGGIVLENLKWAGLYAGLRPGERCFSYTSTGWVLWNMLISGLSRGATIVCYEGSPAWGSDNSPDLGAVWEVAARTRADLMFLGAALVTATQNAGVVPRDRYDLSRLRTLMVSGSALPTDGYRFVRESISPSLRMDSTSGGTDVCTGFVGGNDLLEVRVGEISGALAGDAVAAWDDNGKPVVDQVGELVVTRPMPSMPLYLWNDPDGVRYRESYFDTWPGIWRHGDWVTETGHGSFVIHGRSDATLNRAGVRLGSSDFYDVVDSMPEVADSLVVGVDLPGGGYWLGLFVVPAAGTVVDDDLRGRISALLRSKLTPRHIPDEIVAAPGVPHTLTGKRLEVPVKKLITGVPVERAANIAAVDSPETLLWYADFASKRFGAAARHEERTA